MDSGPDSSTCTQEAVGDLRRRLLPADALPLALAARALALQRVQHALLAVHVLRLAQPLLAAARAVVGRVVARAPVLALLLLAPDDAVLDVDVEGAVTGAVDAAAAAHDAVPGPLLPHQVFPAAVGPGERRRVLRPCRRIFQREAERQRSARSDEFATVSNRFGHLLLRVDKAGLRSCRVKVQAMGFGNDGDGVNQDAVKRRRFRTPWPAPSQRDTTAARL